MVSFLLLPPSFFNQFVELSLGVLGAKPIDEIGDLVLQTTIVHISGDTGRKFVYQVIDIFWLQPSRIGIVAQSVHDGGTIINGRFGLKFHVAIAFVADRSAMFG
jgi:hypothetical protein